MLKVDLSRGAAASLFALLFAGTAATAQSQSVITGKVVNTAGAPVAGANIFVRQLSIGTTTNQNGVYTLQIPAARMTSQQVVVTARFIGYVPQDRPVQLTPGSHTEDFTLKADPFRLEQMVV